MPRYKFHNLPKKYREKDYEDAVNYIVKKYSKIKGLLSIYEWGSVSNPGISDVDIVFVFKNNVKRALSLSKRSFYFTNRKIRYLARHPFVFIDETSFENIRFIYPKVDLKLRYGKNIPINKINKKIEKEANTSLLNDLIVRHYPRDYSQQLKDRKINVRDTLLRLNALRYTVKEMMSLSNKKNAKWIKFMNQAQQLRETWFSKKDFNFLIKLSEEAYDICFEVIEVFRNYLMKNKIVTVDSGNKASYKGIKNKTKFLRDWNKEHRSMLPLELTPQLIEYSKQKGEISKYIRKNLKSNLSYKLKHKELIKKRIAILNSQAGLANKLKHSDFVAFFDFGYRSKTGINNCILNILDKIKH